MAVFGGVQIDWLAMYQRYIPGSLPVVGSMLVHYANLDTGEVEREVVHGHQFEGSFDSSVRVRCDGTTVEVSGNPSRLNRADNVFGLQSIDECIGIYNQVLALLGLPMFTTSGDRLRQYARGDSVIPGMDPVITRVDLAENYTAGSHSDAIRVMRWLSGQQIAGKVGYLYGDGCTVDWFKGSRHVYMKYYIKGVSLFREGRKQGLVKMDDRVLFTDAYYARVACWAYDCGVIRHEVSLKGKKLERLGLKSPGSWDIEKVESVMNEYRVHKRTDVGISSYQEVAEQLRAVGVDDRQAVRAQQAILSWLGGMDLKRELPKTTFYRMRSLLLQVGVDIALPCDVSRLPIQVRTINLSSLAVPQWYQRAA